MRCFHKIIGFLIIILILDITWITFTACSITPTIPLPPFHRIQPAAIAPISRTPHTLCKDNKGDFLITDLQHNAILMRTASGKDLPPLRQLGEITLKQPCALAFHQATQTLFISDLGLRAIIKYDQHSKTSTILTIPGQRWLPTAITVTSGGTLYVADSFNGRVYLHTPEGFVIIYQTPRDKNRAFYPLLISALNENIALYDQNRHTLFNISSNGTIQWQKRIKLRSPIAYMATDNKGRVYLVNTLFAQIKIYDKMGVLIGGWRNSPEISIFQKPTACYYNQQEQILYIVDAEDSTIIQLDIAQ